MIQRSTSLLIRMLAPRKVDNIRHPVRHHEIHANPETTSEKYEIEIMRPRFFFSQDETLI